MLTPTHGDQESGLKKDPQLNYLSLLNGLIINGIQVNRNLRQPSYYSAVTLDELKAESLSIISDLLTSQKVPLWLSQRIGWYYSVNNFQEISTNLNTDEHISINHEKCNLRVYFMFFV
jgi:hypothetical protein